MLIAEILKDSDYKLEIFSEKRIGTGGVQTNISSSDILNILIPKIDSTTQEQIASKIQKSFTLRKVAKDLLESAKSKIENAIENVK